MVGGRGLKGGSVGACDCTYHPARFARAVMETTIHLLIVGEDCRRVASEAGLSVEKLHPTKDVLERFHKDVRSRGKKDWPRGSVTAGMWRGVGFAHNTPVMGGGCLDNTWERIVVELR